MIPEAKLARDQRSPEIHMIEGSRDLHETARPGEAPEDRLARVWQRLFEDYELRDPDPSEDLPRGRESDAETDIRRISDRTC